MYKFSNVFDFQKKSKIKAGNGILGGKYPFYTSSVELSKSIDDFLFDKDSLVFGTGGNASIHFANNKFAVSTDCLVAQSHKNDINVKFFYYYLYGNIHILDQGFKGAGLKHISKSYIFNIELPKVSKKKQDKIVQILDIADRLRQKRKEQLKLLDDYLKSIFLEMFGDPVRNEKKFDVIPIRETVVDVRYGSSKKANIINGQFPMLRMNNITYSGEWNLTDLKYIDLETNEIEKYTVEKGDLLFNRTNSKELVGKTAVFINDETMAYAGYLIRCRFDLKKANPVYVSAWLNSDYGKAKLSHMCKNIVGMANINAQELQNINILFPPIESQNKFASIVEQVEQTKRKMCASLDKMDNHFNALMQRYFG